MALPRVLELCWGLDWPLEPFFGNFGVAPPAHYGRITSIIPREHGGNMDNRALTQGATVYFPVFNPGATGLDQRVAADRRTTGQQRIASWLIRHVSRRMASLLGTMPLKTEGLGEATQPYLDR